MTTAKSTTSSFSELVKYFGSQQATAKALNVKQGTVSGWVRGLHGCTADVAIKAEIATKGSIKARDLRPSIPSITKNGQFLQNTLSTKEEAPDAQPLP